MYIAGQIYGCMLNITKKLQEKHNLEKKSDKNF